ncbi:hypothetical protein WJX82_004646 [Trebouxia sp. C0006]
MQPSSFSKRAAALRDLKRKPVPHQGPPRFSAATSHEQNDAYMQEFDTAYAELEAMSLAQKGSAQGITAHRPNATAGIPHRASSTARPAAQKSTASQPAQQMQSAYPAHLNSSWRSGPADPAGRICNVSDVPLMCSSINWSAGEVVVGSADHALYVVDVQTGKKRRTLYTKTAGHAEWVTTYTFFSGGQDGHLKMWDPRSKRYGQEAQRWLSTVYAAMDKMPAGKLFALLKPSITVHLVKQANFFIEEAFQGQDQSQVFSAGHSTGSKAVDAQRFYNAQCAVYIYYRVLQGLLASATGKHTRSGAIADARVASLASNQTLQLALLTCAVELTHYCTTGAATFPDVTSKLGQHTAGLDIWEAAQHFLHYLAAESTIPMADSVSNYLLFMRMKVVESLAWQTGSSLYQAICEGGGGSCCPGDYALVSEQESCVR